MVQELTLSRVLGPFSKENPKIVKPRKSWVVLQPSFRFSDLEGLYFRNLLTELITVILPIKASLDNEHRSWLHRAELRQQLKDQPSTLM